VLVLAAPITLILAVQVWHFADQTPAVVVLHAWLARAGVSIAALTGLTSLVFGVRSVRSAKSSRDSTGLGWAGLLLSLAALGLWVMTAIALLNTTESLLRLHGL
jgi:FtsH-binding integral membrane protein